MRGNPTGLMNVSSHEESFSNVHKHNRLLGLGLLAGACELDVGSAHPCVPKTNVVVGGRREERRRAMVQASNAQRFHASGEVRTSLLEMHGAHRLNKMHIDRSLKHHPSSSDDGENEHDAHDRSNEASSSDVVGCLVIEPMPEVFS